MDFKEGDEVIMLENCCMNEKGKKYRLKMYEDELCAWTGNYEDSCTCENFWKLVKKAPESRIEKQVGFINRIEKCLDEVIEKMDEFIEATDDRLSVLEKKQPKKEKTDSEIIMASLLYCCHRLSNKHPLSGMHRTGITFNDVQQIIKKLTDE